MAGTCVSLTFSLLQARKRRRGLYYRAGGDGVLHVEIEAEVDHVEDSMASQRGCQAFIQTFQSEAVRLHDASGLSERGGLLERECVRVNKEHLHRSSEWPIYVQQPL